MNLEDTVHLSLTGNSGFDMVKMLDAFFQPFQLQQQSLIRKLIELVFFICGQNLGTSSNLCDYKCGSRWSRRGAADGLQCIGTSACADRVGLRIDVLIFTNF